MTELRAAPDTILLIHGLWMTPRSWEHWQARYEAAGYAVLAPAWPGMEVEVDAEKTVRATKAGWCVGGGCEEGRSEEKSGGEKAAGRGHFHGNGGVTLRASPVEPQGMVGGGA